jgi:hypothetical protein
MKRYTRNMRFFAYFLLSLLLPLNVIAQSIDESEARQRAQDFVSQRNGGKPKVLRSAFKGRRAKSRQKTTACDYYIFNAEAGGGFVIVSGDDRTIPILGYADSGSIQEGSMPEGLKVLLDDYSAQIAGLEDDDVPAQDGRRRAQARKAIAPLIQTKWNQGAPYNNYCPEINSKRTVTGCVATSMAQVMYYYKYPGGECTSIPGYTTKTAELVLDVLPKTTFNWDAMTTTYSSTDTGDAADAVAKLMQYCGWAVQMNYGVNGSSAFNASIPDALKTYFSYDDGIHHAKRNCYTYPEWVELIYSELAAARPVVMGGQSTLDGHSFVCDGYDADDYFHINWGWGGGGDGYFRLAVLQPYERGRGGGSTLDGYSFGQEAVVGIQGRTLGTQGYCLSLEDFYLNDYSTSSSQTFTRESAGDKFKVDLNYTLCSYKHGTNAYDIAFMLLDDCYQPVFTMSQIANSSMTYNSNLYGPHSVELPSIVNGTYYIKIMSRPHSYDDSGAWMECFDGKQYMMTAVVSGNELTISVPYPKNTKPASAAITVEGNKTVGYEQDVIAAITGGAGDYHGNLFLYVNDVAMMGKDVDILAGETVNVHFSYIPTTAGDNTIKISTAKLTADSYVIGEGTTVSILASDALNTQELTIEPTITNLMEGGKLYGNAVRTTVQVKNTSTTNSYVGRVNCSLRMYDNATDAADKYFDAYVKSISVVIPKSESAENLSYFDLNFDYDALDPSKFYRLRFSYLKDNSTASGPVVSAADGNALEMGEGYALYASDGSIIINEKTSALDAGSSPCVDLRGISNFEGITLTASSNPNCIYLLASGVETPSALSSCNVVSGTLANNLTAATLALQDGHDFYTPVPFTATNVSYTRTFTLAANAISGWNTILLPFDVSSVSCEVIGDVDWFHRYSDTGKNFWVRAFTQDAPGYVEFDYADEMAANTPYIIAVPDNRWGSAWQMTDRAVTFSGSNAHIEPTCVCSFGGNSYKFGGCTSSKSLQDVYLLNNDGSSFVFADMSTDVPAFRAWFSPVELSSLTSPALSIGSPETTGIGLTLDPIREDSESAWFDLSGRKLDSAPTKPGLYINNGKMIVIQ